MSEHNVTAPRVGPQQWPRIPRELRDRPQWVLAGPDKVPFAVRGGNASSTDPTTWTDFDTACAAAIERGLSIGFVLTADDPFTCIDFDVKPDTTQDQLNWIWEIAQRFNSYTEQSHSGRGLHVWVRGKVGKGIKRHSVELYSQERYIICTGDVILDRPVENRQSMLSEVAAHLRGHEQPTASLAESPQVESDDDLLAKARGAANADKFNALWAGQHGYPSQSEADLALLGMLAFYSPSNEQCRRLFRMSALGQREKATKDDRYVNLTLAKIRGQQVQQRATYAAMEAAMAPAIDAALRQEQRYQFKQIGEGAVDIKSLHPPTMDLQTMLSSLVLVSAEKTLVAFRDRPAISLTPAGMRTLLSHNWTRFTDANGKSKNKQTFDAWLQDERKITAYTITFDPRAGEFCYSPAQRMALNLWRVRPHTTPEQWRKLVLPFLRHVKYLVPRAGERRRFLDWLAHIEQHPGELPHTHYLMIATSQGVGRGWLSAVLACVWTGHVALDFDLKQSLQSGFNGQLSQKLLAVVDEINEGGMGERWSHSEKLKSMVTTTERFINVKYGLQQSEVNCCRFLLNSNYESALPLTAGDRRWNVIRNPNDPRDSRYYKDLYWLINPRNADASQFVASVREYLRTRDLSKFNPGERAVMNDAKKDVVAASMTSEDEKATALVEASPRDLILAEHLYWCIYEELPDKSPECSRRWKFIPPIAAKAGIERLTKEMTLFGKRGRKVWILRNPQRWKQASAFDVERELARQ